MASRRRFVFMIAGAQSGKTSLGPLWLLNEIEARGPGDYICATATYQLLKKKMLPEFLRVFRDTFHLGEWRAGDHMFTFHRDNTRIIFGSAVNPEGLEAATALAAWCDEPGQDQFSIDSWHAILRRLSLSEGRVLGTTTPYNMGWLKTEIQDRFDAGNPDYDVIRFNSITNPAFPRREYERARREMPEWKFAMFYEGRFTRAAGLIYESFIDLPRAAGGHLLRPFPIPAHWPRVGGIDFGGTNTARLLLATNPATGEHVVYSESLSGGKTTEEHAREARAATADARAVRWYGGARSETQQRMDWGRAGIPIAEPLVADVEAGIDRVIALFKKDRLFVFDTLTGLRDELSTYRRKTTADGQTTEEIQNKRIYHRLDALRYAVSGLSAPVAFDPLILGSVASGWHGR